MVRWLCLLSLCLAAPAAAAVRCKLKPASATSSRPDGYARASLTVEHDGPEQIRAVALRAASGGPWLVVPVVAPPGGTGRATVRLPATSAAMIFAIRGFADPDADPRRAAPLFETRAALAWPASRVSVAPVLHPAVTEAFAGPTSAWSTDFRAQVLIVLATGTVLCVLVLAARRVWLRAVLVIAIAAGTGAALVGLFRVTPLVERRTMYVVGHYEGRSWMTTLTHLAARRTTTARLTLEGPAWCAYGSVEAMAADRTVLRPTTPSVIADTDVVCPLRPGRPQMLLTTSLPMRAAARPAKVVVRRTGDERTLTSDRDTPPALWIEGDRAVRVGPLEAGTPRTLDTQVLQSLDQFDGLDLFRWWVRTARAADIPSLVWITTLDGRPALYVSEVRRAPSPVTAASPRRRR
ncbi:MAG: hypothetical protein ACOC95_06175 [Planctomycetota bacterium]